MRVYSTTIVCTLYYRPFSGASGGSCFPKDFGAGCSGTPAKCTDCNKVVNCGGGSVGSSSFGGGFGGSSSFGGGFGSTSGGGFIGGSGISSGNNFGGNFHCQ